MTSAADNRAREARRRTNIRLAAKWVDSDAPSLTRCAEVGDKVVHIDTRADLVHLVLSGATNIQLASHKPLAEIVWC